MRPERTPTAGRYPEATGTRRTNQHEYHEPREQTAPDASAAAGSAPIHRPTVAPTSWSAVHLIHSAIDVWLPAGKTPPLGSNDAG
jgi:hypothetical protein